MVMDDVSFKKIALGFFMCFPNVEKITISASSNGACLQLWKKMVQLRCDYYRWSNVNYDNCNKTGRIDCISIGFLGYETLDSHNTQRFYINRKMLRLKGKQKTIDTNSKMKTMLNAISYKNNINSMWYIGNGRLQLTNTSGQVFVGHFRGSGTKFSNNCRYEIIKNR